MKRTFAHAFSVLLAVLSLVAAPALGQMAQKDLQSLTTVNLIANPGFENGLARWTNSGSGSIFLTTTAANVGFGTTAASWDAAANADALTAATVTVPSGLTKCFAYLHYKGGDANIVFEALNSSNVVQASWTLATAASFTQSQVLAFTCPSSVYVRLRATANAAVVYIDNVFVGGFLSSATGRVEARDDAEIRAYETQTNGFNYVGFKAPASLGADTVWTLPSADGTTGQVLKTDGLLGLGWADVVTNPMDSAGDMIVGGALGVATKLDSGTSGQWLVSAGAASPAWLDSTTRPKTFSDTTDATSSSTGSIITSGGIGVAKTGYFGTGIKLPTSGGTAATLDYYAEGTFTVNLSGARTMSSQTFTYVRVGKQVTFYNPTNVGSSCTGAQLSSGAGELPAALRPTVATMRIPVTVQNNGALTVGGLQITSAGTLVYSAPVEGAFTNAANCGFYANAVTYNIN
jgi:hypothetical protein